MAVLGVTNIVGHMRRELTIMIPTRIKKRVVFVAIVILALWPIVHHRIVTTYDMDPWLYFGLSMYTRSRPIIEIVDIEAAYAGQPFQSVNRDALRASLPLQLNLHMLADARSAYGMLYNPEPVVEEMFDAFPRDIDRLAFTMRSLSLDAEGMLVPRDARTECRKGKERGDVECAAMPVASEHLPRPRRPSP